MKTFFTRLFVHFEAISHPAGGWFSKSSTTATAGKKKSGAKRAATETPSPDSFHVRGRSTKKSNTNRRTLAP